jgi:hypothetical protein
MRKDILGKLVAFAGVVAISGCLGSAPKGSGGGSGSGSTGNGATGGGTSSGGTSSGGTSSGGSSGGADGGAPAAPDPNLTARVVDYGAALRTAAVKLTGELPTADEIAGVTDATSYGAQLDKYFADPRFARQIKIYFGDMFKMGGQLPVVGTNGKTTNVSLDTAPTFAAEIVINDRPITDLFTATTNTCPTLDTTKGAFTDAVCPVANGLTTSGVLTDPGAMAQFYSNMAFRRVRWIQETFDCIKFPTEFATTPVTMGNGLYTSPWPFTSISGGATANINFQDTSSIVCANCHTTMNHIAPLFANFDVVGAYQTSVQVHTPIPNTPLTIPTDWLPSTETLAWRYGKGITTITDLGTAMAADPAVQECQVQRAWNWAMNKTDIVNDLAIVPDSTIADVMTVFTSSGMKMKATLKAIFTADDYVKF